MQALADYALDALRKRQKGKGKGKDKCWNCGEPGHRNWECEKPKGYLKGLTSVSPEWRAVLDRLHEFQKNRIEAGDLELLTGKREREAHTAYCNELFRIVRARTTGTCQAQVMAGTEYRIFDVVKQWLLAGKDRTMLGQVEIRKKIVEPRRARNMEDYAEAVREWDDNIRKLEAYGGELPHPMDILTAYQKILDDNSRAFAIDKIAEAGFVGQYTGDAPADFLRDLRLKIEGRIAQWQRLGPRAPVAGLLPGGAPEALSPQEIKCRP